MRWKPHEIELLKQHYPTTGIHELMKMLNKTDRKIYNQAQNLGLKKTTEYLEAYYKESAERVKYSDATRFQKGQTPWNKGVKGYMGANVTSFKKGIIPHNTRKEGETRTDKEGYVLVKVGNSKWIRKHRVIWEEANGEIPKGYVIRIKDGNKENYSLDNMELITQADNMRLNTLHQYPEDLKKTIVLLNKLKKKINEKQDSRP